MNLKNKKIWLCALIALLIVAGIGVFYFTNNRGISKALTDEEQQVFVVSRRDIVKSVSLSGTLNIRAQRNCTSLYREQWTLFLWRKERKLVPAKK